MATTTTASPRIKSTVPSTRVLHAINPLVSLILRSPLHRLLSGSVLLLSFTGRKTGTQYTIPVSYTREGETLTIFSSKSWWKNLGSGSLVAVRLQGRARMARAEVIEDHASMLEAAERLASTDGYTAVGRKIGLALDDGHPPSSIELAAAMENRVMLRLILDG